MTTAIGLNRPEFFVETLRNSGRSKTAFEDQDYALLFDPQWDGIEDSERGRRRHLEAQRAQGSKRRDQLRAAVRQATFAVHAQGRYPSGNRVAQLPSEPTAILTAAGRVAWQAALHELGWQTQAGTPASIGPAAEAVTLPKRQSYGLGHTSTG